MSKIDDAFANGEKKPLEIVKSKDLLEIVNKELDKKIVGEEDTRKTIFLCSAGRLVKNCKLASYNLIVNSESGTGKDHVTDNTLKIWSERNHGGEEIVTKRTRISEKVFNYWHNPKFEPEWTWDGKIFYNEDISNNVLNGEVFKVFASSGSSATILINQRPVDIEIPGKPVLIVTTATANPSKEIMRRFTLVNLDETVNQTEAIMEREAELAEKGVSSEYDENLKEALKLLIRMEVRIPYAKKLTKIFPKDHVIMRTHFSRFLDYIKASAVLHQWQREKDMAKKIVKANGLDYDIAREMLLKVTSNSQMIPITKNEQRIVDIFSESYEDEYVSVPELTAKVNFMSEKTLRRELDKLTEFGFFFKSREKRDADKPVMVYRLKKFNKIDIPRWKEIE